MTKTTLSSAFGALAGLVVMLGCIGTLQAQPPNQQDPDICQYRLTIHGEISCPGENITPILINIWGDRMEDYVNFTLVGQGTSLNNIPLPCPPAAAFVSGSFDGGLTFFTLNQPRVKIAGPNGCCLWAWARIDADGYVHIHFEQCIW